MGHFYFLLGIAGLLLVLVVISLARWMGGSGRRPYVADRTLFSPEQRAFLTVLERAVGKGFQIYGMVRVADVIGVSPRLNRRSRRRAQDRLWERRFDFLVCRAADGVIACAVNLAPRSRLGLPLRRDGLDAICSAADLPFVRFRESQVYSVVEIEDRVFSVMHDRPSGERLDEEPPREETHQALQDLSLSIQRERPLQRRSWRQLGRSPKPAPTISPRQAPPSAPAEDGARTAPTMAREQTFSVIDDEPAFSISTDLEMDLEPDRFRGGTDIRSRDRPSRH